MKRNSADFGMMNGSDFDMWRPVNVPFGAHPLMGVDFTLKGMNGQMGFEVFGLSINTGVPFVDDTLNSLSTKASEAVTNTVKLAQSSLTAGLATALTGTGQEILASPAAQEALKQQLAQSALQKASEQLVALKDTAAAAASKASEMIGKYKYYLMVGGVAALAGGVYLMSRRKK